MDFLRQDSQHKTLIQQQFASAHCTQASSPLDENISAKLCVAKKIPYLLADYGMRQIAYEFSGVRRETKIIKIVAYPGGCSKIQLCLGQLLRNVTKPRHMPGGIKKLMCQIGRIFVFKPGKSLFYPFGYVEEERFALEQGSRESNSVADTLIRGKPGAAIEVIKELEQLAQRGAWGPARPAVVGKVQDSARSERLTGEFNDMLPVCA